MKPLGLVSKNFCPLVGFLVHEGKIWSLRFEVFGYFCFVKGRKIFEMRG